MLPVIALSLALLTPQAIAPAPPPAETPSEQPAQPPAPSKLARGKPPCHQPDGSGDYAHVCDVTPPKVLNQVIPEFSLEARKQKVTGTVLVALTVDEHGNSTDVHVVGSLADKVDAKYRKAALSLDDKAVDAVKQYRFAPAIYKGNPVPVELHVLINFQIFK